MNKRSRQRAYYERQYDRNRLEKLWERRLSMPIHRRLPLPPAPREARGASSASLIIARHIAVS
jgi:hypothetical protein